MTRRVLCLWFPNWPIQRWRRSVCAPEDAAVLLYRESGTRGAEVAACCRDSAARGVVSGMPLAEARSLAWPSASKSGPGKTSAGPSPRESVVQIAPYDPRGDHCSLTRLAWWCRRYSPVVGLEEAEEPDSLLLDITGCGHLFGGEQELAEHAVQTLRRQKLFVRAAIADTVGAAWALAHFGRLPRPEVRLPTFQSGSTSTNRERPQTAVVRASVIVAAPGDHEQALRPLPVEALRLPGALIRTLHEFDLRRVGQLLTLARESLPSRFGPLLSERLHQAWGEVGEQVVPCRPPEPVEARQQFEFPLTHHSAIEQAVSQLLESILARLRSRREGILQLDCRFDCLSHEPVCLTVGLIRAGDSTPHLLELLRMQLERTPFPGEVAGIHLHASATAPLGFRQQDLFGLGRSQEAQSALTRLIERLSSRLGAEAVLRPERQADAQPERAVRYVSWLEATVTAGGEQPRSSKSAGAKSGRTSSGGQDVRGPLPSEAALPYGVRPLLLAKEPEAVTVMAVFPEGPPLRFRWKGYDHTIAHAWGPERVETGWWRNDSLRRDYYRIELATGERFWLFRRIVEGDWYLSGEFF